MLMKLKNEILVVDNIKTYFKLDNAIVKAVNGVSFTLGRNEFIGIIGESGSGKSVLLYTILRILPPNAIVKGSIIYENINLLSIKEYKARKIIGKDFAYIPQSIGQALNPVLEVGFQIAEKPIEHLNYSKRQGFKLALKILKSLGLREVNKTVKMFPHELSGGMKQRALIAVGISIPPKVVLADEPTKGLDIIKKRLVIELFKYIRERFNPAGIIVSHDLSFIREIVDKIYVMYCGQIIEIAPTTTFFSKPLHPYSQLLLKSLPINDFKPIPGEPPSMINPPKGCKFHPRCPYANSICRRVEPGFYTPEHGRFVKCHIYGG